MAYVYGCGSVSVVFLFLGLKEVFFYISKCWKHLGGMLTAFKLSW